MPPKPDIPYSPNASVAPEVQQPADYMRAEATPDAFGAQIGQAEQRAGPVAQQLGTQATDLAIHQQGMINETLATNAETQYMTQLGATLGKYKSTAGLEAVSSLPQATTDITALRQKIAQDIPNPAAQRAFTTLALRHEGYALQDANAYAAQQVKSADTESAKASMTVATSRAGDITVAGDDKRFNDTLQDSNFAIARILGNQGFGPGSGTGMAQDPATGALSFDESTPQGKQAKAAYDQMVDMVHGAAWENRLHALADQNVIGAYQKFQQNRDQIPGQTQVKLASYFEPKIRGAQAQATATDVLSNADAIYSRGINDIANGGTTSSLPDAIFHQESGNQGNPTSIDGAKGPAQITPATWAQYAKPGESIDNPADNRAVGQRIIADLSQKFSGDPARVAVGYFSGPGNVAPPGSPTPWINDTMDGNGKSVSSYVSDVTAKMGGSTSSTITVPTPADGAPKFVSKADFYRANYAQILDQARTQAAQDHPDDPVYQAQATARVEQRINDVIRQQELSYKADNDLVFQAFNGDMSKGTRPTSVEQLTQVSPAVKDAWDRMQANNPQAAYAIETRILTANAKGTDKDTKEYGPGYLPLLRAVSAPPGSADRLTDPAQLYSHVGNDLTIAGMQMIRKEMDGRGTPEGTAEGKMKDGAIAYGKHLLSFEADYGIYKLRDPKGEDAFNVGFLPAFYQAYDAGKAAGKTPAQLLSKDSPDFIVDKVASAFKRPPQEQMGDLINAQVGAPGATAQASGPPAIPPAAIEFLKSNPNLRAQFEVKYGSGSASNILTAPAPSVPMVQ